MLWKEIEKDPNHLTINIGTARGLGADNFKSDVLDKLVELEKKWGGGALMKSSPNKHMHLDTKSAASHSHVARE